MEIINESIQSNKEAYIDAILEATKKYLKLVEAESSWEQSTFGTIRWDLREDNSHFIMNHLLIIDQVLLQYKSVHAADEDVRKMVGAAWQAIKDVTAYNLEYDGALRLIYKPITIAFKDDMYRARTSSFISRKSKADLKVQYNSVLREIIVYILDYLESSDLYGTDKFYQGEGN